MTDPRPRVLHKRVTPYRKEPIPEAFLRFAETRVRFLEACAFDESIRYLLACAYLQGITDCCEAHVRNPWLVLDGIVWC